MLIYLLFDSFYYCLIGFHLKGDRSDSRMSDQNATMSYPKRQAALIRSLSSEVHCDKQRIRCKMGYLFALMVILASTSIWTNVFFMRRSRLSVEGGSSFEQLMANDLKLAEVAADLNLAGFESHESRVVVSQTTTVHRTSVQDARRIRKLRNPKYAPKITPRQQSLSDESSFAACMLIKDDNEILSEWIAYHYFVLKLRKIIIAIDPLSTESPSEILVSGMALEAAEVDNLSIALAGDLAAAGWSARAATKTGLRQSAGGGPWAFSILVSHRELLQAAPGARRGEVLE